MVSFRGHRARIPRTFTSWEVKEDGQDEKSFNRWTNRDIIPAPPEERNYTAKGYFGFWIAAAVNSSAWSLGSSNLANGLTAGEAIGMVLVGSFIAGLIAFICGEPGVQYHLGFPMMSRASFGMYGSYFVVMLKCFVNFIYFGIQAYWGGLAVKVMLSSIFPSFQHMANTLPESADITTNQLVGFIIYIIVFTPLMLVHPTKYHKLLYWAFGASVATMGGLFIWAVAANGGASVLGPKKSISAATRSFRMLQAVSSVAGAWTGSSIRQADWTRYAKTKRAPAINQLVTVPLTITITAMLGVFATSAVYNMYGKEIWQPIQLLEFLLTDNYNAATRAGCFFAGLGFFWSQISVNLVQNSVAAGMDLASIAPRWIDVKRGSLIMCFVGYLINPWRFVNAPGTFITVLNSFGMFISPLAAINAVDFWLVRRRKWKVPDLYVGNSSSIYWFNWGLHWRAFLAWTLGIWPSFPGFIVAIGGWKTTNGSWLKLFQAAWFIGFLGGGLVYYAVCLITPPVGRPYFKEYFGNEHHEVIDGFPESNSGVDTPQDVEKETAVTSLKGAHV
ncbi:permease for cytosine/purines, uracil, thiamine, allantoin-domain-containing protein [Halenospora varia]|nr:permease for cytosine/purines, uracil, thiamine, allantoin-domain-containing protein [Halenospora varia]